MGKEQRWVEKYTMINVVQTLPIDMQEIFVEIVGAIDHELLVALQATEEPTRAQRVTVMDILSNEFCRNLQADWEPTDRGKLIDYTLGAFLLRWPIEHEAPISCPPSCPTTCRLWSLLKSRLYKSRT